MPKVFPSAILACSFLLSACHPYEVSVNDKVVYEPAPLFQDYAITDPTLKACVKASIREQHVKRANELKELICPAGDIQSLEGISVFTGLTKLGLADNKLSSIRGVKSLLRLKRLNVKGNTVADFSELKGLRELILIDATANKNARCETLPESTNSLEVRRPEHCSI